MDDLAHVVNKVVENCAMQGVDDVSRILAALVALARSLANIVGAPLSSMQACRKGLTIKVVPDMRVRACVRAVRERERAHVVCFHVPFTRWVKVTRPDPKLSAPKHTPSTLTDGLT